MTYKDICNKYGTRFIFNGDKNFLDNPVIYTVINNRSDDWFKHDIINPESGLISTFKDDDTIMDEEITIIT